MQEWDKKTRRPSMQWGLRDAVPDGCEVAWGARGILGPGGEVDIPYDRSSFSEAAYRDDAARARLRGWLVAHDGDMRAGVAREWRQGRADGGMTYLCGDDAGVWFGRLSGGYVYLAAWLLEHVPAEPVGGDA